MKWTNYQLFLAFMMLVTGSINTLSAKWADRSEAVGSDGGHPRPFDHPFFQAVGMFLGEWSCMWVFMALRFYNQRKNKPMELGPQTFSPLVFLPAALCDMTATSLMYVGLNLTFASSFQMLRGAVMIFTALLSVAFLGRSIKCYMWIGMVFVVAGLVLVGVADIFFGATKKSDINGVIAGDLLIVMAQVITAVQMVYEEKYVTKHNVPPLQAVGWEGFFGFFILGSLLIPFYFIRVGSFLAGGRPNDRLEDAIDAFKQMGNNWQIAVATLGNVVSIAFFNFSGISVTKELSATTRMVLDSCRTLVIWVFALAVQWQIFKYREFLIQATGFVLLLIGMYVYNDLVCGPFLRRRGRCITCLGDQSDEATPLIDEDRPSVNEGLDRAYGGYEGESINAAIT